MLRSRGILIAGIRQPSSALFAAEVGRTVFAPCRSGLKQVNAEELCSRCGLDISRHSPTPIDRAESRAFVTGGFDMARPHET
jgi:hypothetical protein